MAAMLDCEKMGKTKLNHLGMIHRTYINNKSLPESLLQGQYFGHSTMCKSNYVLWQALAAILNLSTNNVANSIETFQYVLNGSEVWIDFFFQNKWTYN